MNRRIAAAFTEDLKSETNLILQAGYAPGGQIKREHIGTTVDLSIEPNANTAGSEARVATYVDAYGSDDWAQKVFGSKGDDVNPNGYGYIAATATDAQNADASFLTFADPYGVILPQRKITAGLATAVKVAMTCLKRAAMYEVHSAAELALASPALQAGFAKTFGPDVADNKPVCEEIIKEVGSLKTLTDMVDNTSNTNLRGYSIDTSDIFAIVT